MLRLDLVQVMEAPTSCGLIERSGAYSTGLVCRGNHTGAIDWPKSIVEYEEKALFWSCLGIKEIRRQQEHVLVTKPRADEASPRSTSIRASGHLRPEVRTG